MNYRRKLSKASKYIGNLDIPLKGEDLGLVKMLLKESFIAGIEEGQSLPIDSVSECVTWTTDEILNIIEENEHIDHLRIFFTKHGR